MSSEDLFEAMRRALTKTARVQDPPEQGDTGDPSLDPQEPPQDPGEDGP